MSGRNEINNGLLSGSQLGKLHVLFALGTAVLILPTLVVLVAKEDSWITLTLAWPLNYVFLFAPLALNKRFPNFSVVTYSQKILGRWGGTLYMLIYIGFFILLSAFTLRNMGDFIGTAILPETPRWFTHITFMIVIAYGVLLGAEVIGRTGELLFMWIFIVTGIVFLLLFNKMDYNNMFPILANGWGQPLGGLYPIVGFPLGEYTFMMMLLQLVRPEDRPKLRRKLWSYAVVIGVSALAMTFLLLTVLGVELATRSPYAVYDMAKEIDLGDVVERVEITIAVIWISTVFTKFVLCFYVANLAAAELLRFSTYRSLTVPLAFIVVPLSLVVYRNSAQITQFAFDSWPVLSVFQGLVMPLALLAIAAMRGLRDDSYPAINVIPGAGGNAGGG
ncbi:endospore germination permease, partial [Paenibacillus sepulcri]|nr:endospore germination permease [Paenibacillus sepulcri]